VETGATPVAALMAAVFTAWIRLKKSPPAHCRRQRTSGEIV
jgi:hypothetical protein